MNLATIAGALIGFAIGRFPGLVLGALIGYFLSRMTLGTVVRAAVGKLQQQFLESTFAVMGAVCKADGQITEDEIRVAEALFERLRLDSASRQTARAAFNRGKTAGFDLDAEVQTFRNACRGQQSLLQMFLQVQISAVVADGKMHPAEHEMLMRIARGLGLSEAEVRQLEAMLLGGGRASEASAPQRLENAYRVLGVSPSAPDAEVKKAYRRLMSQNHPDKLAAKGLPESMRQMAEEKTREITGAYEIVERARAQS